MRTFMHAVVVAILAFVGTAPTQAEPSRVYWDPTVTKIGSDAQPEYIGDSPVVAMITLNGKVMTAFSNCGPPNPAPSCIHLSPDGKNLGGGQRLYGGSSPIIAMAVLDDRVLTAFSNCGKPDPKPFCIHLSKFGENPAVGQRVYGGDSRVIAIAAVDGKVLTAFSNCGSSDPKSFCIHLSKIGENPGGGQRVYGADSPITAMVTIDGNVLTAFANCGKPDPKPFCIHLSKVGENPGGGQRVYGADSPVIAMAAFDGKVLTAFAKCGKPDPHPFCAHISKIGDDSGTGARVYGGDTPISVILPYNGVYTAFLGKSDERACGGWHGFACNAAKEAERFAQTVGNTIESIARNPAEIFPVCWGSPQECRDGVKKTNDAKPPLEQAPTLYSVTYRVDCVDVTTGASRADTTITVTSPVSIEAAVNEVLREDRTRDLCQSNGDNTRRKVPGSGRWM